MSSASIKELTSANFAEETSKGLCVVDFWAPWCGPCRMMGPVFEAVSEMKMDDVRFFKVNIDESPDVAAKFGVQSIPTIVVLRDGVEADLSVGFIRQDALISLINRNK